MSSLTVFDFGGEGVRVLERNGEPWFVASDVARVLGYTNPHEAIRTHCKGVSETRTPSAGGEQTVKIIPERDVYRLVMRSKLPAAERFEDWVTGEVLPSIRKTGSYGIDPVKALNDPATLRQLLLENVEKVLALEGAVAEARPKVEVYDRLVESSDTLGFREACKDIHAATGAKEPEVKAMMVFRRWIQRLGGRLSPAHYGQEQGYVTVREREIVNGDGEKKFVQELRITRKGVTRAIDLLKKERAA